MLRPHLPPAGMWVRWHSGDGGGCLKTRIFRHACQRIKAYVCRSIQHVNLLLHSLAPGHRPFVHDCVGRRIPICRTHAWAAS